MDAIEVETGLKVDLTYEVYSNRLQREHFHEKLGFDPKLFPTEYLTNPRPGIAFVYVCTIQRMRINLFGRPEGLGGTGDADEEEDTGKIEGIPIDGFDCIIADECHRGYTTME